MLPKIRKLIEDIKAGTASRSAMAAEKLARLKQPSVIDDLLPCLFGWTDAPTVSAESAIQVIAAFGKNSQVCAELVRRMKRGSADEKIAAAWALAHSPQPGALFALKIQAARASNENAAVFALHALKALAWAHPKLEKKVISILLPRTKSSKPGIRRAALECLSHLDDPRCTVAIENAAHDSDPVIKAMIPGWKEQRLLDPGR